MTTYSVGGSSLRMPLLLLLTPPDRAYIPRPPGRSSVAGVGAGGGWCYDLDSCLGRSKGALGSTNPAKSKDGKTANMEGGYFSTDPAINPQMYNWCVHVDHDRVACLCYVIHVADCHRRVSPPSSLSPLSVAARCHQECRVPSVL